MKKSVLFVGAATMLLLTSCATMFSGSKAKVTVRNDEVRTPVTISYDGRTEQNVFLPYTIKMNRGFSKTIVTASAQGYEDCRVEVKKKFNGTTLWNLLNFWGFGIDAATGAMMKPETDEIFLPLRHIGSTQQVVMENQPVIKQEERVTRDNAGKTSLERTVIRWFFDSDPQGARVFWRVISSVPDEVKNTNESYLGTTPFEETRSFNILGLTYANSRDVQIEVKIKRKGYMDQTKRFNVRQAIDQQEISSFYDLVKE